LKGENEYERNYKQGNEISRAPLLGQRGLSTGKIDRFLKQDHSQPVLSLSNEASRTRSLHIEIGYFEKKINQPTIKNVSIQQYQSFE